MTEIPNLIPLSPCTVLESQAHRKRDMSSTFWCLIFGLAAIAVSSCSGRVLPRAAEESGEPEDLSNNNVETSTSRWESEEWLKVSLAPEAVVEHRLGTPVELECEIMGTPPPQVKWIRGPYNANSVSGADATRLQGNISNAFGPSLPRLTSSRRTSSVRPPEE